MCFPEFAHVRYIVHYKVVKLYLPQKQKAFFLFFSNERHHIGTLKYTTIKLLTMGEGFNSCCFNMASKHDIFFTANSDIF